jgi:hypothetical protein
MLCVDVTVPLYCFSGHKLAHQLVTAVCQEQLRANSIVGWVPVTKRAHDESVKVVYRPPSSESLPSYCCNVHNASDDPKSDSHDSMLHQVLHVSPKGKTTQKH